MNATMAVLSIARGTRARRRCFPLTLLPILGLVWPALPATLQAQSRPERAGQGIEPQFTPEKATILALDGEVGDNA
jgi:hypothetical protein